MLVYLMSVPLETKEAKVTPLFSKDLTDFPGKEGLMITVEYPPAARTPYIATTRMLSPMCSRAHRDAVRGGKEVTLTPWSDLLTKVPLMCTSSGETQAKPNRRNS